MMQLRTACLFLLSLALAADVHYTRIQSFGQIPDGTAYNRTQPIVRFPTLFHSKKIAMLVAPYAEDAEVYYQYDYFKRRGATIEILTPEGGDLIISDFIKPNYLIRGTTKLADVCKENREYDGVYISGGAPSSAGIRADPCAKELIWRHSSRGKLVAPICSGAEALIEPGLAKGIHLTGSPTSRGTLERAGATYHLVPVVRHANLVIGQGPVYSLDFVHAITRFFQPTTTPRTPQPGPQTYIDPAVFHRLTSLEDIPKGPWRNATQPAVANARQFKGKKVAIIAAHSSQFMEVQYMDRFFSARGATVDFFCPGWQEHTGVVLSDGIRPTYLLKARSAGHVARKPDYDIVLLAATPWSSTVLQNDHDVLELLYNAHAHGATLGAVETGPDVLGAAGLLRDRHVTGHRYVQHNLEAEGALFHDTAVVRDPTANIVSARSGEDMQEFVMAIAREFKENHTPLTNETILLYLVIGLIAVVLVMLIANICIGCSAYRTIRQSNEPLAEGLLNS